MGTVNKEMLKSSARDLIKDVLRYEVPTFKDKTNRFYFVNADELIGYADSLISEFDGNKVDAASELLYTTYGGYAAVTKGIRVEDTYVLSFYDRIENDFMYWFNETYVNDRYNTSGALMEGTYDEITQMQADAAEVLYEVIQQFEIDHVLNAMLENVTG